MSNDLRRKVAQQLIKSNNEDINKAADLALARLDINEAETKLTEYSDLLKSRIKRLERLEALNKLHNIKAQPYKEI